MSTEHGLRGHRRSTELTLTRFAELMHVSPATASRWESGLRRPHSSDFARIAAVLRCEPHEVRSWFVATGVLSSETVPSARNLRILRERRGITRAQLGSAIGITAATVAHWECGRRGMPASRIPRLAEVLAVTPGQLVNTLAAPPPADRPAPLLTQLRCRAGLTQRQVAAAIGVSYGTVSAWERGIRRPAWPQIRGLRRIYRCQLRQIATALDAQPLPTLTATTIHTHDLGDVLRDLRRWRGESLRCVAERIGVDWGTLRRWERGESRPQRGHVASLEIALGVSCGTLASARRRARP